MEEYARYYVMLMERAEKHARWIRNGGDCRTKWRQIVWNDIKVWKLSAFDKKHLYDAYVKKVDELAPVIIAKAPARPRITVSAL